MSKENEISYGARFINPSEIIERMEIPLGCVAADFGCGTGYFSLPLAKKIGQGGTVYALDILKQKLESVESQAKIMGLTNIITKRVNLERKNGSGLETASCDWVILVNMLFMNDDKSAIMAEVKRVLKGGGRVLVAEWSDEEAAFGPEAAKKVSQNEITEIARKNSLSVIRELKISNFHWGLELIK
ncbi:MAG: hypothetical protein QG620_212 [Patescibacteria group bacterium]|nr:hypothetical protein [Patescibacteria group bacterium]